MDIRRKVGNRIIRAYLLENILKEEYTERVEGRLRGPKDEFKDFDMFLILSFQNDKEEYRILAESGVYENLRIVGTDSKSLMDASAEDVISFFTEALQDPDKFSAKITISNKSKVSTK